MTRRWFLAVGLILGLFPALPLRATHDDLGEIIQNRIETVEIGKPHSYRGLTIIPLTASDVGELDYLTLDEAVKQKAIRLLEKGSGEVNSVRAENLTNKRVFIMDGEEIVGAKQNRILNSSVMIGPRRVVELPVSCVEQGRWTASSPEFRSEGTQLFAGGRQMNSLVVAKNRETSPTRPANSDQSQIWQRVEEKRAKLNVTSGSSAMHDVYTARSSDIEAYVKHFEPVSRQVGALFAIDSKIIGADIFDRRETFVKVMAKLVRSYALDAIEFDRFSSKKEQVATDDARQFINLACRSDVKVRDYSSAGDGRDIRLTSARISGAGLVVSSVPVHIALFAPECDDPMPLPAHSDRLLPPSERRHQINRR